MKLSSRILLFLFGFALLPLLFAVAINLPLVLDRVELFYRQAILQHLRADFRDLDQHLASRDEMVRLLAKLPEPGVIMGTEELKDADKVRVARTRYTDWINRILANQLDVLDIVFLDAQGTSRYWLSRDIASHQWLANDRLPDLPPVESIAEVLSSPGLFVHFSPVRVNPDAEIPAYAITLQLVSPILDSDGKHSIGVVVMTVDIGGLMRSNPETLWMHADGSYLQVPGLPSRTTLAFEDFPGLEKTIASGNAGLWEGKGNNAVIWVPMLRTEDNQALWVGRPVDRQPLMDVRNALIIRVLSIILALVVFIGLSARWIATRIESRGNALIRGIGRVLEHNEAVKFDWRGSPEIRKIATDLTVLAGKHAQNSRELAEHTAELEASNRYKSEFLANVSHELKTPLNSILSLSKLILHQPNNLPDPLREQVRVINNAGQDLRRLIDNILDLSKIEAGELELHPEPVDVRVLARELIALMQPQFDEKALPLQLELEDGLPETLTTDADKLRQVLKNFLGNALKFTHSGKVVLRVCPAEEPYAVSFVVEDSGIGISADKHALIFEAFKQADGSTSRRYGGTGLGLSISSQLAERLGGEILLDSVPGKGSQFTLMLPLQPGAYPISAGTPGLPRKQQAAAPSGKPAADLSALQVLLVDEDVQQLLYLTSLLESWNARVMLASDSEEALETLEDSPVCRVVLYATGEDCQVASNEIGNLRDIAGNTLYLVAIGNESDCLASADACVGMPIDELQLLEALQRAPGPC